METYGILSPIVLTHFIIKRMNSLLKS